MQRDRRTRTERALDWAVEELAPRLVGFVTAAAICYALGELLGL